jgi:hypothetical protein
MAYQQAYNGAEEIIYYSNGIENGFVRNETSFPWVASAYVGPETSKTRDDPPVGHILQLYNGRMLIARNNLLYYSEPFAYSWYDLTRGYIQFNSRIRLVGPGPDGLWISTEDAIYFLKGPNPAEAHIRQITTYPAIENTLVIVDAGHVGQAKFLGLLPMFATQYGICLGTPEANLVNLTENKVVMNDFAADVVRGSAYIKDNKYHCVLNA